MNGILKTRLQNSNVYNRLIDVTKRHVVMHSH